MTDSLRQQIERLVTWGVWKSDAAFMADLTALLRGSAQPELKEDERLKDIHCPQCNRQGTLYAVQDYWLWSCDTCHNDSTLLQIVAYRPVRGSAQEDVSVERQTLKAILLLLDDAAPGTNINRRLRELAEAALATSAASRCSVGGLLPSVPNGEDSGVSAPADFDSLPLSVAPEAQQEPVPCDACGGSGRMVVGEQHVTHDMASDAGEPAMEGMSLGPEWGECDTCEGSGISPAPDAEEQTAHEV